MELKEENPTTVVEDNQKMSFSQKMSENHIRVAVVGNVDAGKSTLIGTLKSGQLDNGRGQSRENIMKHRHEIETGRTSTIATHLLGYDENCNPIMMTGAHKSSLHKSGTSKNNNDDEVASRAHSLVSLVDLAGHEKYLKSTIHGISSGMVDYALVLVNSRHIPTHMTCHHINLAVACGIPIVIVLTKLDDCPAHVMKSTKEEVNKLLRSPNMQHKPYQVKKASDISIVKTSMHAITPIIAISCVTGEGLDLLNSLLASLPKRRFHQNKVERTFEYLVEDTFQVTGVGAVVSGFANAGRICVGDKVFVGPVGNSDGSFIPTIVKSAHIARMHVNNVVAGNSACLGLALSKDERKLLRKGMVVLEGKSEASLMFEAEIMVVRGSGVDGTTIKAGYETMVHILHMKQCAQVLKVEILNDDLQQHSSSSFGVVRAGGRARITFCFLKRKEFIRPGMRVLIRDGHVRGCGKITKVGVTPGEMK